MVQKSTFFQFQAVLASKLAPTWVPKTGPKSTQNLANRLQICSSLQDAPKMSRNLEKHPEICQNLQKWYQHGRNMEPKFCQAGQAGQQPAVARASRKYWPKVPIFLIIFYLKLAASTKKPAYCFKSIREPPQISRNLQILKKWHQHGCQTRGNEPEAVAE